MLYVFSKMVKRFHFVYYSYFIRMISEIFDLRRKEGECHVTNIDRTHCIIYRTHCTIKSRYKGRTIVQKNYGSVLYEDILNCTRNIHDLNISSYRYVLSEVRCMV